MSIDCKLKPRSKLYDARAADNKGRKWRLERDLMSLREPISNISSEVTSEMRGSLRLED